jgi:hypothetical protein
LTCKPTKIPRQRKRKPNNKEDQIYFEVLEGAISWRYLPKFLISVLFFRRFFCFIAYSHKSVRPSLISTPIEKGTTIPETDFDHQAIKLNKHQKNQRGGVIQGKARTFHNWNDIVRRTLSCLGETIPAGARVF